MIGARVLRNPPRQPRSEGFSDPAFAHIAELAYLLAGLVFPPNRQPSAEAGMRRAMASLRISTPGELAQAAESAGEARDAVFAELTVGESYFFRDAAQLDLLETEILPNRIKRYGAGRPLRIWSAGCASGEEPYTLAIMLQELRWPHPAQIMGTDIAQPRLAAARRGRYTRWALRGVSEARVSRWFRQSATHFDLDASVRESVEFARFNLVLDDYPESTEHNPGYDLILCRNVMIYFDLAIVARIAAHLLKSLAPDGWLLLGASDPPLAQLVDCDAIMTPAGVAYRRADHPERRSVRALPVVRNAPHHEVSRPHWSEEPATVSDPLVVQAVAPATEAPRPGELVPALADDIHVAYARADYATVEKMAALALAADRGRQDAVPLWVLHVRAVANQGRLHEAGELCTRALELHPLAAELHYLHATLLAEGTWHRDAAAAARRAIYLDRKLVMAHLTLGDALSRTGDAAGARIAFENVVALLSATDTDSPIAGADGVPASRLRQVAVLRLASLGGAR